ncbi:MAG: 50S ribosomal protein L24 [Actinobacteria bacterium]|nr:50S ribosomal protein L24 [Actinomycetota bacterium]
MSAVATLKTRLKKGDMVMVITGRERGKTGKVLSLRPADAKIVVEKLNIIKRHTKPSQKARQGGILEREAPIAVSNVMYYCGNCQKAVRLGIKTLDDGRRVRVCKKCKEVVEKV